MSKSARVRTQNARQKIAAQQAAARRAQKRRRILIAGGSVATVLVLVAVFIVISLGKTPAPAAPAAADAAAARDLATVPAATFGQVGAGTAGGLKAITGQPELVASGKPELLYMGGEYCPYCAAERWAIAAAVSRFGTLSGVRFIHSSSSDVYPSTPTLTFLGSRYISKYLSFVPVEWYGQKADPSTPFRHVYLQHPTAQQAALFSKLSGNSIPFVDIGNRYVVPQTQYVPSALAGLTWTQVASAMHDPSSPVARDIDGAANMITAAICTVTGGQPGGVCTSPGVTAASRSI